MVVRPNFVGSWSVMCFVWLLFTIGRDKNKLDELAVVSTGLRRISLIINESEGKNLWVIVKIAFFAPLL